MPRIFSKEGFEFFLYSNEHLPIHVHVRRGGGEAMFVIGRRAILRRSRGLKVQELARAEKLADENKAAILKAWNEHFGNR